MACKHRDLRALWLCKYTLLGVCPPSLGVAKVFSLPVPEYSARVYMSLTKQASAACVMTFHSILQSEPTWHTIG